MEILRGYKRKSSERVFMGDHVTVSHFFYQFHFVVNIKRKPFMYLFEIKENLPTHLTRDTYVSGKIIEVLCGFINTRPLGICFYLVRDDVNGNINFLDFLSCSDEV